jgi:hypothetical protein
MLVEDLINALHQQSLQSPLGWLICFEGRPLQGIPPNGNGPHILFFSAENKAEAFITGRKKFFGEEPLSAVGIDSPDSLKAAALMPCGDTRYAAPPCGIVIDFDYSTNQARRTISSAEVKSMLPEELAGVLGVIPSQATEIKYEPATLVQKIEPRNMPGKYAPGDKDVTWQSTPQGQGGEPAPKIAPKSQPRQNRSLMIVLITCGSLLAIGLLFLCIGATWYGLSHRAIPALPFLHTPTSTMMPTPTTAPTPIPTLTAAPVAWTVNVEDDFSFNRNYWPVGSDQGQYGSSNLAIKNGKLDFMLESVENCWYWWYPDIPSFSDFDASIDVRRIDGSVTGDYGITLRTNGDDDSFYYFAINDANQEFAFYLYQYDSWTTIVDWTANPVIGVGSNNRIEVSAKGSHFVFIINGIEVGQADNASLSSGKLGVLVQLYDSNDKITVQYDNLDLRGNP